MLLFVIIRRSQSRFKIFQSVKRQLSSMAGAVKKIMEFYDDNYKFFVPEGNKELIEFRRKIEFKNLNFSYIKGKQVLKNVSFSIEKGKMTAIVGATGSGKSTLINLLMRFYDCSPGSIFIDNTDIRDFKTASLMKNMALVSQHVDLFNQTLKYNLTYGIRLKNEKQLFFNWLS